MPGSVCFDGRICSGDQFPTVYLLISFRWPVWGIQNEFHRAFSMSAFPMSSAMAPTFYLDLHNITACGSGAGEALQATFPKVNNIRIEANVGLPFGARGSDRERRSRTCRKCRQSGLRRRRAPLARTPQPVNRHAGIRGE
jgi:hypothetical protein